MTKGYITFYWPEDSHIHIQRIRFLRCLKGITYKNRRPLSYSVTILRKDDHTPDLIKLNEWLQQVPRALRKV